MTLRPDQIGDKGQRFLIETLDYPKPDKGWQPAGYSNDDKVEAFARAFLACPGCERVRIVDRENGNESREITSC